MTAKEFFLFAQERKISHLEPSLFDGLFGFRIFFDTGEYVAVGFDEDNITYTHQGEDYVVNSTQLFEELNFIAPDYISKLIKKYSL